MMRAAPVLCSLGVAVVSGVGSPLRADPGPGVISEQHIYDRIVFTPFPAQPEPPNTVP